MLDLTGPRSRRDSLGATSPRTATGGQGSWTVNGGHYRRFLLINGSKKIELSENNLNN